MGLSFKGQLCAYFPLRKWGGGSEAEEVAEADKELELSSAVKEEGEEEAD